jgi:hypothetical protein
MESDSARASSAAEARFRINDANSLPRVVKVVALDGPSRAVVERLAQRSWNGASFLIAPSVTVAPLGNSQSSTAISLRDLAGHSRPLLDEIACADLVVMIAFAGENAHAAATIGEACSLRRVATSALVIRGACTSDAVLSKTLQQLRPWMLMLVVATEEEDYVADILGALRA